MKKIILLILLPIITYSQGWFISHTFSPAQSLQTIKFWDANTGFTTAPLYNSSTFNIHKTTNGGAELERSKLRIYFDALHGYLDYSPRYSFNERK
ncbi:MAG: hypothetical protein K8I03_15715 [Ignavibacteria bacterium]|nr:hypothetical protein [Ignavibacteria bacterium]